MTLFFLPIMLVLIEVRETARLSVKSFRRTLTKGRSPATITMSLLTSQTLSRQMQRVGRWMVWSSSGEGD